MENVDAQEEAEFEVYISNLESTDSDEAREAFEVAAEMAGLRGRKSYQEKLLNTALEKAYSEPTTSMGNRALKFVRDIADRYDSRSESTDFDEVDAILNKIAGMQTADTNVRKLALDKVFEIADFRTNNQTVEIIRDCFASNKRVQKDSFEERAVEYAIKSVQEHADTRNKDGSPLNEIYKIVVDEIVKGNTPEGLTRSFVRDLKKEWETDLDFEALNRIKDSTNVAPDISALASQAVKNR